MSIVNKLKNIELTDDSTVTLTYREGTDVFVHNESEVDTALADTDVVSTFSSLVTTPGLNARTQYGANIIESLRDGDYLEDYERDGTFDEYVSETINNNFYDTDLIDYSIEKYDYKRGYCTLTATVEVDAADLIETDPILSGWEVKVKTPMGTLVIE